MFNTDEEVVSEELGRTVDLFFPKGSTKELRAFNVHNGETLPRSSYFAVVQDAKDFIISQVSDWDMRDAKGIYFSINSLDLRKTINNFELNEETRSKSGQPAQDVNMLAREWILIDIDPIRSPDTSSTQDEHNLAGVISKRIATFLKHKGWPKPVVADSGNGYHLLYKTEPDEKIEEHLSRFLNALAYLFNTDNIEVDTKVFNPARITRFYGTKARKGEDTLDRPHRYSKIDYIPDTLELVTAKQVEDVSLLLPDYNSDVEDVIDPAKAQERMALLDLWLRQNKLTPRGPSPWGKKGRKWVFPICPFNADHIDDSAYIVQFGNGAIYAGCLHDSCAKNSWKQLTEKYGSLITKIKIDDREKTLIKLGGGDETFQPLPNQTGDSKPRTIPPGRFSHTDMGNANRFAYLYGDSVRYVNAWNSWLVWNGSRWVEDDLGGIDIKCKATISAMRLEATSSPTQAMADQTYRWALNSQAVNHVTALKTLAKSEPIIMSSPDNWDKNPMLLNMKNGSYHLDLREFKPHSKDDYCSKICPVEYKPDADCPNWVRFINRIMDNDAKKISYLQRVLGYSLTGMTNEQKIFFFIGTGANGKSTLLDVMQNLMGSYSKVGAPELLTTTKAGESKHPAAIADIAGARLVVCSETEKGTFLSEGLVKALTGEQRIKARYMGKNWFQFTATHKIIMAANHRPVVRGSDNGIWRRIEVLPFDVVIPKEERDVDLIYKLTRELSGIFNWCLTGYYEYKEIGLNTPKEVMAAVEDYKESMDTIGDFLTEQCSLGKNNSVLLSELYEEYVKFCNERNERPYSNQKLREMLVERGCVKKRVEKGTSLIGITLKWLEVKTNG